MLKFIRSNRLLIFGAAAAIAALILFKTCNCTKPPSPPIVTPTKTLKQEAAKLEWNYKKSTDSLQAIAAKLQKEAAMQRKAFTDITAYTRLLEKELKETPLPTADSQRVADYIDVVQSGDSSCERLIGTLELQIINKDSTIAAEQRQHVGVQELLQQALKNADEQEKYAKQLKRNLTWTKLGNKIWKGAAVTAGLYILYTLIK